MQYEMSNDFRLGEQQRFVRKKRRLASRRKISTNKKEIHKMKCTQYFHENKLLIAIVTTTILGTVIGFIINKPVQNLKEADRYTAISIIAFPGEIFLRCLQMLIVPLITLSLVVGISNLDRSIFRKIGTIIIPKIDAKNVVNK